MAEKNLSSKTVLITGVSSGLGLLSLRLLSQKGVQVLGTARTLRKARAACGGTSALPFVMDLSNFNSVVNCADEISALNFPIDALICNAGIMGLPTLQQAHGIEMQLAVNHFGHFILANRLLDRIKQADQGRIVAISSLAWQWAPPSGIQFDNLSGENGYQPLVFYGQSKLANALFSLELSNRLQGSYATSNALHPGIVETNLMRHIPREQWWQFTHSAIDAANMICATAMSPELSNVSGAFIAGNQILAENGSLGDREMASRLWDVSTELTGRYL